MFHVCHNQEQTNASDRLSKVSSFIVVLQFRFQSSYTPEDVVCIDESNVPFRGHLSFRQYTPNKRHRYGIKVFQLCVAGGQTWTLKVYAGKEKTHEIAVSEKVGIELMDGFLDSGRTLYTDNWYTSVSLSKTLIGRKTHLVGTLRLNRKLNPPDVVNAKLKEGEVRALQNKDKTIVLKWKDKIDVLMLSTMHDGPMETYLDRGKEVSKPSVVLEFNKS
ncbi:Transposase IS4 [Popillia japonica]|uniref:Transposase IS4 n=1 Tax=Popillia japonica TaxID=7064 RepID=A0AAW1ME72_POPJA